jgi:hypothetical protein
VAITPADVAGLKPGDIVTVTGLGSTATGPLIEKDGALYMAGYLLVRDVNGNPFPSIDTLVVVSRAPVPVYVNCARNPRDGDVARGAIDLLDTRTWVYSGTNAAWTPLGTGDAPGTGNPTQYRLLVDGNTGRFAAQ